MNEKQIEQSQAAVELFGNESTFTLTDEELLAIHGGGSPTSSAGSESSLATHTGHVGTFVGTGAAAGAAVGGTVGGFLGGPAGAAAGAATGGYWGGTGGLVVGIMNEVYENREAIAHTANGVAEFYATADVG